MLPSATPSRPGFVLPAPAAFRFALGYLAVLGLLLTAPGPTWSAPARLTGSGGGASSAGRRLTGPNDSIVYRLRGQVLDGYTQEPLPYASVWLQRLGLGGVSDEQGYFALDLSAQQFTGYPADTLVVHAAVFRGAAQPIDLFALRPDSVLQVTLARDSTAQRHQPVLLPGRSRRHSDRVPAAGAAQLRRFGR
jgi:hypothetical protein